MLSSFGVVHHQGSHRRQEKVYQSTERTCHDSRGKPALFIFCIFLFFFFSLPKSQFKKDRYKNKKVYRVSFHFFVTISVACCIDQSFIDLSINHFFYFPSFFFYNLSMGMSSCALKKSFTWCKIELMIFFHCQLYFRPLNWIYHELPNNSFFFFSCSLVLKSCSSLT